MAFLERATIVEALTRLNRLLQEQGERVTPRGDVR